MILETAVCALESLIHYVESKRDEFDKYEEKARVMSNTDKFKETRSRNRRRNVRLDPLDYAKIQEAELSPRDNFRNSFIPVLDQLSASLVFHRIKAYDNVRARFGFFNGLEKMDSTHLHAAKNLVEIYKDDLESSLGDELVLQFASLITVGAGTADGKCLPPYIVYKAEHLYNAWALNGPDNARYNCTHRGWFDAGMFEDYFRTVVLEWAKNFKTV